MKNYEILKEYVNKEYGNEWILNFSSPLCEVLKTTQIKRIKEGINFGDYNDIKVVINKQVYYFEICIMYDIKEIDIIPLTKEEYKRYN